MTALVLFDMHDVLCRYDRDSRLAALARLSGKSAEAIYRDIWVSGFEGLGDSGALDEAAYLAGFGERLSYPITRDEWLENRRRSMAPMPEVLALAAAVRQAGRARIAVLTNNHTLVRDHLSILFPALYALCGEAAYVSAQFGAAKPDPQVYLACAAAEGVAPAEILFIDDSPKNVAGAEAAGFQGHVFTNAERLEAVLRSTGCL